MNRKEYLTRLRTGLNRLPKDEVANVMQYYTEYFDEAGPENESAVIEELGDPKEVAGRVIAEMAIRYMREPQRSRKNRMTGVWMAILAVFAAPIALPLAFAAVMMIGALAFAGVMVVFALFLAGASVIVYSVLGVFIGFYYLFVHIPTAIGIWGSSLIALGVSSFIVVGGVQFGKWMVRTIASVVSGVLNRRKRV